MFIRESPSGPLQNPSPAISVATLLTANSAAATSLQGADAAALVDGTIAYVQSLRAYFHLDLTSGATADGISVIAAFNTAAAARWTRLPSDFAGESPWLVQAAWFIDAANGNDENNGSTAALAIASHAEFMRRMGNNPLISQTVTVNILSNLAETLTLEASFAGANGLIHYLGTPTVVAADTAAAWVNADVNAEGQLTGTAIVDFTPHIGRRVTITSGANTGWSTWISAIATTAIGTEIARVGAISAITGAPISTVTTVPVVGGGAGQTFNIEEVPTVQGLNLRGHRLDSAGAGAQTRLTFLVDGLHVLTVNPEEALVVLDCDVAGEDPNIMLFRSSLGSFGDTRISGRSLSIRGCTSSAVAAVTAGAATFSGMFIDLQGHCGGRAVFYDCVLPTASSNAGFRRSYFDGVVNTTPVAFLGGTTMGPAMGAAGGSRGLDFGVWVNSNAQCILVDVSSFVVFDDVWGAQAGAGDGFRIDGKAIYDTVAEISTLVVGAGNDTVIGGVAIAYGALPSITAANNSMFVTEW